MAIVTVTATGLGSATAPDNFTVSIVNYLNVVTQYATNVSRASLISGYNVTVVPGDTYVRVASTGICTYSTDIDISTAALQTYRPDPIDLATFPESPVSFNVNSGDVKYLMGTISSYSFVDATDFSVDHVSTTGSGGLNTSYGPLLNLEILPHPTVSGDFEIYGYTRNSYSNDATTNTSTYIVTYTFNGLSRNFNFYWTAGL